MGICMYRVAYKASYALCMCNVHSGCCPCVSVNGKQLPVL